MSLAERYSGKNLDKIAFFKEIGVIFYKANMIKALLIRGAAINAEYKLLRQEEIGDHITFVGEIIEIATDENIKPLVYHNDKYWNLAKIFCTFYFAIYQVCKLCIYLIRYSRDGR